MRVLVFGDSITQGFWDAEGGWVEHIREHYDQRQLIDLNNNDEPTIFNLGISADNSKNVLQRIASETVARTRNNSLPVVLVQVGVNDSCLDNTSRVPSVSLPIETYTQNLHKIIEVLEPISSKLILVGLSACDESLTTPVAWGDYHYTNAAIQSYENSMKAVAEAHNIACIPLFDAFLAELQAGKSYLADGLHPNSQGHTFMSEHIFEKLDPLLTPLPAN